VCVSTHREAGTAFLMRSRKDFKMLRRFDSGFTLMETIVALVIFSSVFFAIYNGMAGGWRGVRQAKSDAAAINLARAKLAAAGVETALSDGTEDSGDEDGYSWHIGVQGYPLPDAAQTELAAYWLSIEVNWRNTPISPLRSVTLRTLKLTHP
jgi:prepilin-type N-terminal cleavage/methylation domain-containing protein